MKPGDVPTPDSALAKAVREFCLKDFKPQKRSFASNPVWAALKKTGTELWLDTGDIEEASKLWCSEFTALTTNNTLLNKEIQKGIYDKLIPQAADMLRKADPKMSEDLLVLEIAFILNAVHGLRLVETFNALVSVELHTALTHDAEAAVRYGKRFAAINPNNFIVKVPLSPSGLISARRIGDAGIPVNFTLGFSARQNYVIALASKPAYCNVFLGRLNAFGADHKLNDGSMIGERAMQASQKAITDLRRSQEKSGPAAIKTRHIAASMRSGAQVGELAGCDVFTMPTKAAKEFLDSKPDPAKIRARVADEKKVTWNPGIDQAKERLGVFWEMSDALGQTMCKLYERDVSKLTAAELTSFFRSSGFADLFPDFTEAERARIAKEGKIPVHASWKSEVQKGRMAWDALFTEAGLASFTDDQKALDDRIRKVLKG